MTTGTVVVLVFMFSQCLFRDPRTLNVFLLLLKRCFFSLGIDISMSSCRQVLFSLSFTTMSGLFVMISMSETLLVNGLFSVTKKFESRSHS